MDQYLQLPNASLEVANACSGVRFLVSTMVLSIPLAFITQKTWVQRVLLFLLAILISVIANPLRVTLVAAWAYYGDGDIHGPLHIFQGYVVYLIGMVILFFGAWVLQRMPLLNKKSIQKTAGTGTAGFNDLNKFNLALMASLVVLLGVGAYIHLAKVEPVPLKTSLNELPVTIGEWINASTENDERLFPIPGTDAELVRVYQNASGREVKLQISYFESQRQNKILTYYKLQMLHDKKEELTIPNDTRQAVLVNKSELRNGSQDTLFLSWFNLNGQIITNRYAAKLKTAFNGLVQKRTNGAVVVVSSAVSPDGMETALGDEVSFARALLPVLDNFIPDANR
jgi:EpsI family protein